MPVDGGTTRTTIAATATASARTRSVYMASRARTALRGIRCFDVQYIFHGSLRSLASRRGTVLIVHVSGGTAADNSFHASGIDTGAAGFARVENAAIAVFVRLLRK